MMAGAARAARGWVREFVLIVLGVLVALWVTGWSEARTDRARERADLEQLLATTIENEARVNAAIAADSLALAAARRYLAVLRADDPLPAPDTLAVWTYDAFRNSVFFPVTGAYDAIAQSGGLRLVRDDTLRAQIATYGGVLRGTGQLMDDWAASFHRNWEHLVSVSDVATLRAVDAQSGAGTVAADWRTPELEQALFRQTIIARNRVTALQELRAGTHDLRVRLERHLAD